VNGFISAFLSPPQILAVLPSMLTEGLGNTLLISVVAAVISLVFGAVLAFPLSSPRRLVRAPVRAYVEVFRGVPAIVTVSVIGIGLPAANITPFGRDPLWYAALAVGLMGAAYTAEILRSGIMTVPRGHAEIARSLGRGPLATFVQVVLREAVGNVLPALAGQMIVTVKESSLVYLLGLTAGQRDIYFIAQQAQDATFNSSPYVAAGLCYLLITIPLSVAVNALARRRSRSNQLGA
jgi:polar amino acid transport system permease protein